MDVEAFLEGILQGLDVGDMSQHPQLDLRVVGRDQRMARRGNKSGADLTPVFGANWNVLQVRIVGRQPPGEHRRLAVGSMDPPGTGVDVGGERIGIGAHQLGQLAPVDNGAGEWHALQRQVFEHIGAGGPGAGLGLGAAFEPHLAEEDIA